MEHILYNMYALVFYCQAINYKFINSVSGFTKWYTGNGEAIIWDLLVRFRTRLVGELGAFGDYRADFVPAARCDLFTHLGCCYNFLYPSISKLFSLYSNSQNHKFAS